MRDYCYTHKLSASDVFRYSRQIIMEEIGPEGQQRLKESSVLVIGAGPLGVPIIIYCAAAGIGRLGLVDDSTVDENDLLQTFYDKSCLGSSRIDCVEFVVNRSLFSLNSSVIVEKFFISPSYENLSNAVQHYEYVVDGRNFSISSRTDIAVVCQTLKKILLSGVLTKCDGTVCLMFPSMSRPFSCENCSSVVYAEYQNSQDLCAAISGAAFGFMGCLMSTEIIKQIISVGTQKGWNSKACSRCKRRQAIWKFPLNNVLPANESQLKQSSLLVVGAGGLGSPVSLYCAVAGVGRIGLVDADKVSVDNLHRQIAYKEESVSKTKIDALQKAILKINPKCFVELWDVFINEDNAKNIIERYNLVADCSDNPATRSLISDICGTLDSKKIVVSGSALCWDGQLTVYNSKEKCICFRCLNPEPLSKCTKSCAENGVVGSVVGVVGCLQAMEILRILSGNQPSLAGKIFVYDGFNSCLRKMNLKPNKTTCPVCNGAWVTNKSLMKYASLDAKSSCFNYLLASDRITAEDLDNVLNTPNDHPYLIDTRPSHQFKIGHLKHAINVPFSELQQMDQSEVLDILKTTVEEMEKRGVNVICRRGSQSQLAVLYLRRKFCALPPLTFKDIIGGYTSWHSDVDNMFPIY